MYITFSVYLSVFHGVNFEIDFCGIARSLLARSGLCRTFQRGKKALVSSLD